MKITRLKMINWRRYYGEHDIKFAVDKKRNITIFYGENNGAKKRGDAHSKGTY